MASIIKILYLGDIVGRATRDCLSQNLAGIKRMNDVDIVVANAENATSGAGITREHAEFLHRAGIDMMTLGDHVWDRRGFEDDIDNIPYICRPANLPKNTPGRCFISTKIGNIKVGVFVVLGQCFMKIRADNPFESTDELIKNHRDDVDVMLCEVHAEATSEKVAFGWNYDGTVSCVVGTHTHVQTADEKILPKGTAYITDLGMCGSYESVLGREIQDVVHSIRSGMPRKLEVANKNVMLNGIILHIDTSSGLATKITRFCEKC